MLQVGTLTFWQTCGYLDTSGGVKICLCMFVKILGVACETWKAMKDLGEPWQVFDGGLWKAMWIWGRRKGWRAMMHLPLHRAWLQHWVADIFNKYVLQRHIWRKRKGKMGFFNISLFVSKGIWLLVLYFVLVCSPHRTAGYFLFSGTSFGFPGRFFSPNSE